MASTLESIVLTTAYQSPSTTPMVPITVRINLSRLSFGRFFSINGLVSRPFREVALQGEHHERIAAGSRILRRRQRGQEHPVCLLQVLSKIVYPSDAFLVTVNDRSGRHAEI